MKKPISLTLLNIFNLLGYQPQKIRQDDHWYVSPLRDEKEPVFKINKQKNIWYDHGLGKGGRLVDFIMQYFKGGLGDALQKISSFHPQKPEKISFKTAVSQASKHFI